jgi:hypothetical protein
MANDALLFILGFANINFAGFSFLRRVSGPGKENQDCPQER